MTVEATKQQFIDAAPLLVHKAQGPFPASAKKKG